MIEPALQGEAFVADVAAHRGADRGCRIWWLGQSGFLVHWRDHFLLLDPYLSDSLTEKYAGTDKPHVRMTGRVVDPERLDMVEVATSSHNHTDHLDAATLLPLRRANPALRLIIPEANRAFVAQRLGCAADWPEGLSDGESLEAGPFRLHAVASAHEQLDRTAGGLYPYLGYIVEVGGIRIYHPGDTVLYEGLAEKLKPFAPDVALLPINGSLPERRVPGNLWGREAALLASEIGAKLVIPCHYSTFEFNSVTPDEFVEHCGRLQQRYHLLRHGEGVDIPPDEA